MKNWRDIPGFENLYAVSDFGRVRSFRRGGRVLRPAYDNRGALVVSLPCKRFASGYRATKVHLLVLRAFVGPCPKGHIGRHLDGNPYHNALINLAYGTPQDNMDDRARHGHTPRGHQKVNACFTESQVIEIRAHPRYKGYQKDLMSKYNVSQSGISHVITGKTYG